MGKLAISMAKLLRNAAAPGALALLGRVGQPRGHVISDGRLAKESLVEF